MTFFRRSTLLLCMAGLTAAVTVLLPAGWIYLGHRDLIYDEPARVPETPLAIVFGAGLTADGRPGSMLADRVDAAVALFRAGRVHGILMTGDKRPGYDEVTAMKNHAVEHGVPADRVSVDDAGFRTYDSLYRARTVFGVEKTVLVTQRYHLPRALFLARSLGCKAVGLAAGHDHYHDQYYYELRELAALAFSWYEVTMFRSPPHSLGNETALKRRHQ